MNDGNSDNQSALHVAVDKRHLSIVKLLSKNGTFLNFHMTNTAVQNQYLDILDYLLSKRILPDVTAAYGEIPLLRAVASENMALVECLIKYGAE